MPEMKQCGRCHEWKPLSDFYQRMSGKRAGKYHSACRKCTIERSHEYSLAHHDQVKKRMLNWLHQTGRCRPMAEAKDESMYLGVFIAERVLSNFFDRIERMPMNNPGYDFLCGKGFKIDVKSACHRVTGNTPGWHFTTKHNDVADYFLCLAFDDRESLDPQHVWLIPRGAIKGKVGIWISSKPHLLVKWSAYERPLDKVLACCDTLRSEALVFAAHKHRLIADELPAA